MRASRSIQLIVILLMAGTSPAFAQRILDWPLRTSAEPAAVVRGPEAAFWNPAAVIAGTGRGEVIVADQRTPSMIGISGFAAAGSWRLDERTVVAAGYQHVSIDDIGETSTSPLPDTGEPTFSISEDQVAVAASHALGTGVTAGAAVRYDRSDESGLNESSTMLGAGFLVSPLVALHPVVGASVFTQSGDVRYTAGLSLTSPRIGDDFQLRGGYGVRGGKNALTVEHRIGITGIWRELITVTGGVATAQAAERSWEPVLGASLRVSRYELGVLRENLANNFGAAYSFRFRVGLK